MRAESACVLLTIPAALKMAPVSVALKKSTSTRKALPGATKLPYFTLRASFSTAIDLPNPLRRCSSHVAACVSASSIITPGSTGNVGKWSARYSSDKLTYLTATMRSSLICSILSIRLNFNAFPKEAEWGFVMVGGTVFKRPCLRDGASDPGCRIVYGGRLRHRDERVAIRIIAPPMSLSAPGFRSHLTLALATILHAFTHAYSVLLVPLYLLVRDELHLRYVSSVSLVVTLYGLVYCLGSYGSGVLADRFNRKVLL